MLPFASGVKHFFASWLNRLAQCVVPVTREMHSMQTLSPCQHKNRNSFNATAKALPAANFHGRISCQPPPTSAPFL